MDVAAFIETCLTKEEFYLFTDFFNFEWAEKYLVDFRKIFKKYSIRTFSKADDVIFEKFFANRSTNCINILINPPEQVDLYLKPVIYTIPFPRIDCIPFHMIPDEKLIKLLQETKLTNCISYFMCPMKKLYIYPEGNVPLNYNLEKTGIFIENFEMTPDDMFHIILYRLSVSDMKISKSLFKIVKKSIVRVKQARNLEVETC